MVSSQGWRIEAYVHPDDFHQDVKRLVEGAEARSIQLGAVWYKNLIQTVYSSDKGVAFYTLRGDGFPMAVMPVRVCNGRFGKVLESLSNYYSSIYSPVFSDTLEARDVVRFLDGIRDEHGSISILRFDPMDPESPEFRILMDALRMGGYAPFPFFCFGNWYLEVPGDWAAYWADREGILRNTVKRMERKLQKEGGALELVTGGAELEQAIEDFNQVYAASWKHPEPYPDFMPGLVRACADQGWLRLGIVRLRGIPIAAQVWIVAHGRAEIYKLAYHEDYKSYAPGKVLSAFMMRHVIENDRVSQVDYLTGDDPYKKSWMSNRRERWGIVAYNPRTPLGLTGLIREGLGRLAKRLVSGLRRKPALQIADQAAGQS